MLSDRLFCFIFHIFYFGEVITYNPNELKGQLRWFRQWCLKKFLKLQTPFFKQILLWYINKNYLRNKSKEKTEVMWLTQKWELRSPSSTLPGIPRKCSSEPLGFTEPGLISLITPLDFTNNNNHNNYYLFIIYNVIGAPPTLF